MLWLGLILALGFFGSAEKIHTGLFEEPPCESEHDCPQVECYWHACEEGLCQYERKPISECCLDHEECCSLARPTELGLCINCECVFVPNRTVQCLTDYDCDGTRAGLQCRASGSCQVPVCSGSGFCSCVNTTGQDWDNDGVPCPEDCDDLHPGRQELRYCRPDEDADGFVPCDRINTCRQFCVGIDEGCPAGYVDLSPSASDHLSLPADPTPPAICEEPQLPPITCDCCDTDHLTYPFSPYVGAHPNGCGSYDYDCSGSTTQYACCDATSVSDVRDVYDIQDCYETPLECGGCGGTQGVPELEIGWVCNDECEAGDIMDASGCPEACGQTCTCAKPEATPLTGQCAQVVTGCHEIRPGIFTDAEECCVITSG